MPNCQAQIFTAKRLSKNAKFDLFDIRKCQLATWATTTLNNNRCSCFRSSTWFSSVFTS